MQEPIILTSGRGNVVENSIIYIINHTDTEVWLGYVSHRKNLTHEIILPTSFKVGDIFSVDDASYKILEFGNDAEESMARNFMRSTVLIESVSAEGRK